MGRYGISTTKSPSAPKEAVAVDLGMSVKWANINVGATKPKEYGDYFAWGETAPKGIHTSIVLIHPMAK